MTKWILGAFLIALTANVARAQTAGPVSDGRKDLGVEATELRDAVNSGILKPEEIAEKTYRFSNEGLPNADAAFRFHRTFWAEYERPENKNATMDTIMREGEKALRGAKTLPEPEVVNAFQEGVELFKQGKIDFGPLEDNQAGVYNYQSGKREVGTVQANEFFKMMARLVPPKLLYATIIHEAKHAEDHMDGKLSPEQVKRGEISAFHTQCLYLNAISTNGQEIATTYQTLDDLAKKTHHPAAIRAANYVFALLALWRTHADEQRLLEYVDHMGYQENGSRAKTAPASSLRF